jgi:hypothetical protein
MKNLTFSYFGKYWFILVGLIFTVSLLLLVIFDSASGDNLQQHTRQEVNEQYFPLVYRSDSTESAYVLLGWNDLGMHCYNRDFTDLAVLPPYNTLWTQVILRGDPPQIVTQNIRVEFRFPNNTYSVGSPTSLLSW